MDSFLLTKALNYHGQELLRAIEEEQGMEKLRCIDLRTLDYHEYHKRAKEFGFKERQKRQKIFRFIGKKAEMLFSPPEDNPNDGIPSWDADNEGAEEILFTLLALETAKDDLCAVMPPLESFMSVPGSEKRRHFFENLKRFDLVVGQVARLLDAGLNIQLLSMDAGKKRDIADLGIKVYAYLNSMDSKSVLDEFQVKDYVRGVVLGITERVDKIKIGFKLSSLSQQQQEQQIKLGLISEEEVPVHYKKCLIINGQTYEHVLHSTLGFCNPNTVGHMCELLGLPRNQSMSFMRTLYKANYPKETFASELRKAQSAKWAYKSVRDGVAFFKAGDQVEAFQCLNKALQIYSDNVEALVARGALFANNSNFRRALEDFEKALELEPKHVNGKKYMSETLVALGRYYEEKNDLDEAAKTYKRAVLINTDNSNAKDALIAMEMRDKRKKTIVKEPIAASQASSRSVESVVRPVLYPMTDTREKLKILLKEEKREKYVSPSPDVDRPVVSRKRAWSPQASDERLSISDTERPTSSKKRAWSPEEISGDSMHHRERSRRIAREQSEEHYSRGRHQQQMKQRVSSTSSSSSSTSRSRSSSSSSSSSSSAPARKEALRPPSPKVVFVMRKDDDLHYSKLYTHAAFREEDEEPLQKESDAESSPQSKKYKRSSSVRENSGDENADRDTTSREKRTKRHYRSRHSSSDSVEESPKRRRRSSREDDRESNSRSRHQYHHYQPKPYYRDRGHHHHNYHHYNQRPHRFQYRGRGRFFRGHNQQYSPRRGRGRWVRPGGVVISRAPDIEALKRLKEEKQRQKSTSPTPPSVKILKSRVTQNWIPDTDSMSAARAAAELINEAIRSADETPTKETGPNLVKDYDSGGEEAAAMAAMTAASGGAPPSKQSLAAMESFLEELRAQKKAALLASNKDARKKP